MMPYCTMSDNSDDSSIDYLVIAHLTKDLQMGSSQLGGTAAYAGLTAQALGLKVGIVTSAGPDIDFEPLSALNKFSLPAAHSTTFENRYNPDGQTQIIHQLAKPLSFGSIPGEWLSAPIIHLGPIANEVDTDLIRRFPNAMVGLTPQGWLRRWDSNGLVYHENWQALKDIVPAADAVVLSTEDLDRESSIAKALSVSCKLLVITDGANGAHVYWNKECRHFPAPEIEERCPTGAGDIFAAVFFAHFHHSQNPWEAARLANLLAATSVTRRGLAGAPRQAEVEAARIQLNL